MQVRVLRPTSPRPRVGARGAAVEHPWVPLVLWPWAVCPFVVLFQEACVRLPPPGSVALFLALFSVLLLQPQGTPGRPLLRGVPQRAEVEYGSYFRLILWSRAFLRVGS